MSIRTQLGLFALLLLAHSTWAQTDRSVVGSNKVDGEILRLGGPGVVFEARFKNSAISEALGGVVLLHGAGQHADWPLIIRPFRLALPKYGWRTLSLELRPLAKDTSIGAQADWLRDAHVRISEGLRFLGDEDSVNNVLIGLGSGAVAAMQYSVKDEEPRVSGWVAIRPTQLWAGDDGGLDLSGNRVPGFLYVGAGQATDWQERISSIIQPDFVRPDIAVGHYSARWFREEADSVKKRVRGWLKRKVDGTGSDSSGR